MPEVAARVRELSCNIGGVCFDSVAHVYQYHEATDIVALAGCNIITGRGSCNTTVGVGRYPHDIVRLGHADLYFSPNMLLSIRGSYLAIRIGLLSLLWRLPAP